MQSLLILGGAGQLGSALREVFPGAQIAAPTHAEFDIVNGDIAPLIAQHAPTLVINCAAFHNVDRCEREPDAAFAANALAVDRLAAACAARGVPFLTVSTDYVFDGRASHAYREADAVNPLTSYGASKAAGEMLTRRHGDRHYIIRTSGVFGTIGSSSKGYTLIDKVLAQAERGDPTRMVCDVVFSPSFAPHIARTIAAIVEREAFGTHHLTNAGAVSWFDFVATAFRKAGLGDAPLTPVTYAEFGNPVRRPMYSPLENTTFAAAGIPAMPSWETALDDYLVARAARSAQPVA